MKLLYVEEDKLNDLKANIDQLKDKFCEKTNDWLEDYFGELPFKESKYTVEPFELDMSNTKPYLTDFENVKRVYGRLKSLTAAVAMDERLWAGLCLGPFWNYTQYRWKVLKDCSRNNILNHFLFGYSTRRSFTRNALARLWWIGKFTYDEKRKDPFELTEYVCKHQDIIFHTLERTAISNNKKVLLPFLSALNDALKQNYKVNTDVVGKLSKNFNLLGGVYILDALSEEYIYKKTFDLIRNILE